MKQLFCLFVSCLFFSALSAKHTTRFQENSDSLRMQQWVDSVFDSMTPEERIGQLFMPIVEVKNTPANRELVRKYVEEYKIGGILFSKGKTLEQAEITNFAQERSRIPLFISLDGEWGLSMRLQGTTRFPRNMMLGAVTNDSLIYAYGEEVGRQCREMGITINFAPVLDLNSNPANPVIGTRSFGEDKELVTRKSIRYGKGLESHKVMAVGKHFPGHGDTDSDSHHTLPLLAHDSVRLNEYELAPFREYIQAGLSGMLTAHLAVPALDDNQKQPSSLSSRIVTDLLKEKMGFSGLVFTDGLAMKGVSGEPNHCVRALLAGNDVLLGPIQVPAQVERVRLAVRNGEIPMSVIEEKCLKVLRYKYLTEAAKVTHVRTEGLNGRLNTRHAEQLNRRLHAEAITILKDDNHTLPLQRLDEKRISVVSVGNTEPGAFIRTMAKYAPQKSYVMNSKTVKATQDQIIQNTRSSNLLVVGISSDKSQEVAFVRNLCAGRRFILVFFQSPYRMKNFKTLIPEAEAVVMAYENSDLAREYAAQLIYGGIDARGVLSVTVPQLFKAGTGIQRVKTRLGYTMPEEEAMQYQRLKKIDDIIREGMEHKAFPGCQLLIARNGNIVWEKSYGYFDYAQSKAVENEDVYDLASVTKAAATVPALMKVQDEYNLSTQHKISQYIPELKGTDKQNLTFREALFHETGLRPSYPFYQMAINYDSLEGPLYKNKRDLHHRLQADERLFADSRYQYIPDLVADKKTEQFCLEVAEGLYLNKAFQDSILNKLISLPVKNRGKYQYSCLNFVLLRKAIENISGKRLDQYVERKLYAPLGAYHTMYQPLRQIDRNHIAPTENDHFLRKQILIGYVHDEIAAFEGGVEGNAGLFSNAGDLAKLLQLLLNQGEYGGERFFTRETARLYTMTKSPKSRRGLGFDKPNLTNPLNSPTAVQAPASVFGHTGFTGTCFWIDPDNQLIYIFLTNRVYPNRWNKKLMSENIRTRIQEVIYDSMKR